MANVGHQRLKPDNSILFKSSVEMLQLFEDYILTLPYPRKASARTLYLKRCAPNGESSPSQGMLGTRLEDLGLTN